MVCIRQNSIDHRIPQHSLLSTSSKSSSSYSSFLHVRDYRSIFSFAAQSSSSFISSQRLIFCFYPHIYRAKFQSCFIIYQGMPFWGISSLSISNIYPFQLWRSGLEEVVMSTRFPSLVLMSFLLEEAKGRGRDSFILRSASLASECRWQFLQMGQQMRFSCLLWKMIWLQCCPPSSMMTEGVSSSVEKWGYWMVAGMICTCWKSSGWAYLFFLNLSNLDFCFCWEWQPALFLTVLTGLSGYSQSRFCFLLGLLDLSVYTNTSTTSSSVVSALEQLLSSMTSTPSDGGWLKSLLKGSHLSLAQFWSSSSKLQQTCLLSSLSWLRKHWEGMVNPYTAILYIPQQRYLSI